MARFFIPSSALYCRYVATSAWISRSRRLISIDLPLIALLLFEDIANEKRHRSSSRCKKWWNRTMPSRKGDLRCCYVVPSKGCTQWPMPRSILWLRLGVRSGGWWLAMGKNTKSKWPKYKVKYKEYPTWFLYVESVPGTVPAKRKAPLPAKKETASRQKGNSFPPHPSSLPAKSGPNWPYQAEKMQLRNQYVSDCSDL